ncbi:hypothetical protein IGI04_034598 [Brassica rapa subsp. trilocularis]|uniref:Uncharacterized protein n=1 Tax=Brassica rapa subsp. trilocularis TaxID=1813537 RepID=A0ABQ7LCG0_BRACM|nr:hypothetical protein IGI04_034598 [Brassica rapa subsp. trilocularis]
MAEGCLLDPQRLVLLSLLVTAIRILTRWMTLITTTHNRKRHVMLDAKCEHREKTKKTLRKDSAGCSQQADTMDDAKKKVADTNDMYTNTVATADANINIERSHEVETAAIIFDFNDQDPSELDMV